VNVNEPFEQLRMEQERSKALREENERLRDSLETLTKETAAAIGRTGIATDSLLIKIGLEVIRAKLLHNSPCRVAIVLVEEVGELFEELLKNDRSALQGLIDGEAIQVAAMALRIALEGDPAVEGETKDPVHIALIRCAVELGQIARRIRRKVSKEEIRSCIVDLSCAVSDLSSALTLSP
jgi:NTP pyrophosphatase (non-canonical NTP hydrolase)